MRNYFTLFLAALVAVITLTFSGLAQNSDVELEYKADVNQAKTGDEIEVDLMLKNPDRQNVISVRSWLEYNPAHLEGLSIETDDSPFTLSAPGEDAFDAERGQVKIGRSNISGGVKDQEVKVATVRFRVKTTSGATTIIHPYDYQVTELGHVSVNIIDQGFPVNVLSREPEDLLLTLNSGAPAGGGQALIPQPIDLAPQPSVSLARPLYLLANTGPGYVDLVWQAPPDLNRTGFYVYYGKVSGQYARRRNVDQANQTRIDGLPNGEVYFFAITAYDSVARESDYSDEVGVIVGEPFSSTAPFPGLLQATLGRLPNQPENGPLAWWLLFSAVGLSGAILFRSKNKVLKTHV